MTRAILMMVAFTLSALVLGGNVFHDQSGLASQGGNPMNVTRITVEHIRVVAEKPFDQVTITLAPKKLDTNPTARARGVPQSPRWRVGLVCAGM